MKDLELNALVCMAKLDAIGIKYGNIVSVVVNTRAKSRWGQCKSIGGNRYTINISASLLADDAPQIGLEETLMHELAHSVKGCMNHKANWKAVVDRINRAYGYHIKRTNSAEDKGFTDEQIEVRQSVKRYACSCAKCGYTIYRERLSDFVKRPGRYIHSGCGGHFERTV